MNKYYIEYVKAWRKRNPNKVALYQKRWLEKHREQHKKYANDYYHKNKMRLKCFGYKGTGTSPGKGWSIIRLKVLARDDCICQKCYEEAREVHHKDGTGSNRPEKDKNNSMDNLITVCHRCHMQLEVGRRVFNNKNWVEDKERNKKIIELSKKYSQVKISKMYGITRQRVNQILNNWAKKEAGVL